MAKTTTKDKDKTGTGAPPATAEVHGELVTVAAGGAQLRLPYPRSLETLGVLPRDWQVYIDAIWPSAKTVEGVLMAVNYCKARNLDPLKKVVHIVPMYSAAAKAKNPDGDGMIETVWPGIAEVRITATRTGVYAGKDEMKFGPEVTKNFQNIDTRNDAIRDQKEITFPEWAELTVYKIVQGIRCAFVGPKVYWEEAYAQESRFSPIPNEMWRDRRHGQLDKCAEAAALRAAFPEELGGEYTAEEMHGRVIDGHAVTVEVDPKIAVPPKPSHSAFQRQPDLVDTSEKTNKPAAKKEPAKKPDTKKTEKAVDNKPAAADPPPKDEEVERKAARAAEFEDWYSEQVAQIAKCTKVTGPEGLTALFDATMVQLEGDDAKRKDFDGRCAARQREILEASRKSK